MDPVSHRLRSLQSLALVIGATLTAACGALFDIGELPALAVPADGATPGVEGAGEAGTKETTRDGAVAAEGAAAGDFADPRWALWPIPADQPAASSFRIDSHANGTTATDLVTGLMWQDTVSNVKRSVDDSRAYCDDLVYGGFDDWRLPTRIELMSIMSFESDGVKLQPSAMSGLADFAAGYWTTSIVDVSAAATNWAVDQSGVRLRGAESNVYFARCVRLAPPLGPHTRHPWNLDATSVKDPITGLVWERNPPASSMSRTAAAGRCAALKLRGKAARLPTVKELASIVDEEVQSPAHDAVFGPFVRWIMTSSQETSLAWEVDFLSGEVQTTNGGDTAATRCVLTE